jgi:hypothetical protein
MTLAGSLEALCVASDSLADAFAAARLTICEDQPHAGSTLAVDELAETLIELDGETTQLRDHIHTVVLGPAQPTRKQALELISLAQSALNDISDAIASWVGSRERRVELERVARRGGAQWTGWWTAALRGLAECEPPLRGLRNALFACWRELASGDSPMPVATRPGAMATHGDLSAHVVLHTVVEEPAGGPQK